MRLTQIYLDEHDLGLQSSESTQRGSTRVVEFGGQFIDDLQHERATIYDDNFTILKKGIVYEDINLANGHNTLLHMALGSNFGTYTRRLEAGETLLLFTHNGVVTPSLKMNEREQLGKKIYILNCALMLSGMTAENLLPNPYLEEYEKYMDTIGGLDFLG